MAFDRHLVALDHVEDAVRQAGLLVEIAARRREKEGSFSDGFKIKQLPQAIAIGDIQSGIMAGKLKGVMPATTPSGWRTE